MKSIRLLDRRAGYSLASIGLLLGMVAPAVLPAFASAALLTSRSITLSNSAADASSVSYNVKFTAPGNIGATGGSEGGVIIGFCSDTPLTGAPCTMPSGFSTSGVAVTGVKYAGSAAGSNGTVSSIDFTAAPNANSGVKWTAGSAYTGGTTFEMTLTGIHNPTSTGSFYARITTYADKTALDTWTDDDTLGSYADDGAVALAATNSVGVTAYVVESMVFCVSGANPGPTCGTSGQAVTSPSLTLGETVGSVKALNTANLSTGTIYAQLSTNASGGAVVNLKSDATSCGGLYRNGNTANCNIAPMATPANGSTGFSAGEAYFGLTVGAESDAPGATGTSGALDSTNGYDDTHYFIDYDAGDTTGVTSSYGSNILNTAGAPVNNKYVPITLGASISNVTPAGVYGATLNMIGVGTF